MCHLLWRLLCHPVISGFGFEGGKGRDEEIWGSGVPYCIYAEPSLRVQGTRTSGIYGFYTMNRNNDFQEFGIHSVLGYLGPLGKAALQTSDDCTPGCDVADVPTALETLTYAPVQQPKSSM